MHASTRHPLRRFVQVVAGLAVTAAVALGMPLAASADTGDFTFTSFEADYYLSRDDAGHSTLRTVEKFVAEFPDFDQNRGMVRVLPNDYDGVPLNTTVESVTDATGAPVYFEVIDQGGSIELPLGTDDFVRGTQTYVIEYTQQNVVRAFADTKNDEFYWDTNGTGFDQPFGSVTARVHVDPSVTEFLTGDTACYSGGQGDTTACPVTDAASPDFGEMFTSTVQGLGPRQNVSMAIGFAPGTFVQVPASAGGSSGDGSDSDEGIPALVLQILVLLVCVLGAVAAGIRRLFARRDARGRGTIIAQYSVPEGYNLLEAADLVNRPKTAIAAQLVSFAVRGNVRILDYPVSDSAAEYTLQLLSIEGVDAQERELLATLFSGLTVGAVRELGTVDKFLARQLTDLRPATRRLVTARGGRVKATSRAGRWIIRAMYIVAGIGVAGVVLVSLIDWAWPLIGVIPFCLLMGVFIAVAEFFARSQFVLTDTGAEQRDYLKGMKVYLELAEEERFRMLQSPEGALRVTVPAAVGSAATGSAATDTLERVKLYEKLLPFAVLWGVEREWARELVFLYEHGAPEPSWYGSQNGFSSLGFGNALGHMAGAVATSSTLPRSPGGGIGGGSFSGGSFGGGFSGGGGGGGGGGGR